MKKIAGSLFLKITAFVLVCILTPILVGSLYYASEAYDEGAYFGKEGSFSTSIICQNFVQSRVIDVSDYVYWEDIAGLERDRFYFDEKNFAYAIYDEDEDLVMSTLKSITGNIADAEGSYIPVIEGYPLREVDENGKVTAEYTVTGFIRRNLTPNADGYDEYLSFSLIKKYSMYFIYAAVLCFIACSALCIYLIASSGYDKEGVLDFRGMNAVDFDIMLFVCAMAIGFLGDALINIRWADTDVYKIVIIFLLLAALTAVTLLGIMSIAAHLKTKKWWHHTFIWQCGSLIAKFVRWFFRNIGITWKLAVMLGAYSVIIYFFGVFTNAYHFGVLSLFLAALSTVAGICIAMWFGVQLKKLKRGGEAIANGDFDYRINSRELWPMLRGHAYNLNSAALGMSKAVDDRLKSERFKTELITNVSHDLKTPLTSIVSYVDLLKKEEIENENAKEYIDVIDRQSAKLKKLTEDLVEASKASSGAVAVNRELLNIGELINQSVGEFSEKLEAADIVPVVNLPEEELTVFTDGRLLWRVFDNLIQNIIKYAQPGTRAYFDLVNAEGRAVLTMRNISRDPLNMSADALMERFVRGDSSRNSEGNGLGLSIAKSLTELCGGTFELRLDGDLFKIVITIPCTAEAPLEEEPAEKTE